MLTPSYAVRCSHSLTVIPPPPSIPQSLFNPSLFTPLFRVLVPYSPVPIPSSLLSLSDQASSGKTGKSSSSKSSKGKSSKPSASKKEPKKPSFLATVKAFFKSLVDPQ